MAKILLTKTNIEEHICRQTGALHAGKNMIISPGIRDYLQNEGISIVYGAKPETAETAKTEKSAATAPEPVAAEGSAEYGDPGLAALAGRIVAILQKEYQVTDEARVKELCLRVIKQIDQK